jgi:aldehyde dehydrogenase (NAD+)
MRRRAVGEHARHEALATVLAEHDDVDAVWYVGGREGAAAVGRAATQVKKVWVPYGE